MNQNPSGGGPNHPNPSPMTLPYPSMHPPTINTPFKKSLQTKATSPLWPLSGKIISDGLKLNAMTLISFPT